MWPASDNDRLLAVLARLAEMHWSKLRVTSVPVAPRAVHVLDVQVMTCHGKATRARESVIYTHVTYRFMPLHR